MVFEKNEKLDYKRQLKLSICVNKHYFCEQIILVIKKDEKLGHPFKFINKNQHTLLGENIIFKNVKIFQERNKVFATNSDFLIPISLKYDGVNLISNFDFFLCSQNS